MMGKAAMRHGSRTDKASVAKSANFSKVSAFTKLLCQEIGLWAEVPDAATDLDLRVVTKFSFEFQKIANKQSVKIGTPTSATLKNWWIGRFRPTKKLWPVVLAMLLGTDDERAERRAALQKLWEASDMKAENRKKSRPPSDVPGRQTGQPAGLYRPVPRRSEYTETPIVHMVIDFAHPRQNTPLDIDQDMVEAGLPVKVDLNWGFENDPEVPCELYLKEFHLIPELTNCDEVADTAFDPATSGKVQAKRSGNRWIFKTGQDVAFLEGKYPDLARLFMVRQTAEAIGLPVVKVTGVCPGAEQIVAVWKDTATDAGTKQQPAIDRQKQAVIERCLIRWTEGKKKGQIHLRSASVELIKRKP